MNEEELKELKEILSTITTHIPEHQASYVWRMYSKVAGDKGNQPCMCGSAAKYWKQAIDTLRNYVKDK